MFNTISSQKARGGFLSAMINDNVYLVLASGSVTDQLWA